MRGISKSLQNMVIQDYKIGKNYEVDVTFINDPHSFYIRPTDCKILKVLEKRGKPAQTSNLFPGSAVVYKSVIGNEFVRGKIVGLNKSDGQTLSIFAIDYGYFDKSVDIKAIFEPEIKLDMPPLAKQCRLANCEPIDGTFTDDVTEAMKTYIGNEYCIMSVKAFHIDRMFVKLSNTCPNDIATMLGITHYTNFGMDANVTASQMKSIKPVVLNFLPKSLKVNDVLYIRILRANSVISNTYFVANVDDFKEYTKKYKDFTHYCQSQSVLAKENLVVGKSVAYKQQFNSLYERATIKSILETGYKALIYLIDTGQTKEAILDQLKVVQCVQYFETPGIAYQCTFEESLNVAGKLPEDMIPGYEVWIKIKEIGDPNIVEKVSKPDTFDNSVVF